MTVQSGQQLSLMPTGEELRDVGIASVSRHRWVDKARIIAEGLCRAPWWVSGTVTSDDIHVVMEPPPHVNCYGAIFDKRFVATGERVRSTRPEAHGRWIEVWRLA